MTIADIERAWEAFFDALVDPRWRTRPVEAQTDLERRRAELKRAASRVDRSLWPRGVSTLLWRPPDRHHPDPRPPDEVVPLPDIEDDE